MWTRRTGLVVRSPESTGTQHDAVVAYLWRRWGGAAAASRHNLFCNVSPSLIRVPNSDLLKDRVEDEHVIKWESEQADDDCVFVLWMKWQKSTKGKKKKKSSKDRSA